MAGNFDQSDYVDVKERIQKFYGQFPDGSLVCDRWYPIEVGEKTFIVYEALAYRTPNDERPASGTAWEPFPGPTPFTKDSELMNAETAAFGRAIAALGIAVDRGVASKQEMLRKQAQGIETIDEERVKALVKLWRKTDIQGDALAIQFGAAGADKPKTDDEEGRANAFRALTPEQADAIEAAFVKAQKKGEGIKV